MQISKSGDLSSVVAENLQQDDHKQNNLAPNWIGT